MRPAAHLLSFASPKESRQRKGDPTCRVPALRCGQPAMLGHGAALRNSLRAPKGAPLKQPQRVRARSAAILRCPRPPHALRFSARPEGVGEKTGHRFARPRTQKRPLGSFWHPQKAAEQAMPANAVLGLVPSTGVVPPHAVRGGKAPQATQGGHRSSISSIIARTCSTAPRPASLTGIMRWATHWGRMAWTSSGAT